MSANLIPVSERINANVAGQTRAAADVAPLPSAFAPTLTEIVSPGAIENMMSGGVHPEAIPAFAATQLQKATNSVTGPLGGLIPARGSTVAPGPAGGAAAATANVFGTLPDTLATGVKTTTTAVTDATTAAGRRVAGVVSSVRSFFAPKAS